MSLLSDNALTRSIYDRSPPLLRSVVASVYGLTKNRSRFKGDYEQWAKLFREAADWPEERLIELQNERLAELVKEAVGHVPYYRRLFGELGLTAEDVRTLDDLHKLPILDKSDVVAAGDDLINERIGRDALLFFPTSGSTGTPLMVARSKLIEQMEWAFLHTRFIPEEAAGRPYASFSGLELLPPDRDQPPFWIDNWANRQRMFSIFHMNEDNLHHFVRALDTRYSFFYWGYSSAIFTIADFMKRKGLRLRRPPKYVIAASEELQPHYAETIEEVFGCRIIARYGLNEQCGSITMRSCGHYHYDMDYAILEFLPARTGEQGEEGTVIAEIIGTNMHDHAWPLLRYRTADLVEYAPGERCEAGHPGQLIRRIHGRSGRYFELPNGSRVTNISVIAKKCSHVSLMQVVQREPGAIVVRVVKSPGFGPSDEQRIHDEFRRKVGRELQIEIEYVDDIERTARGKYISIVNEIEGA